MKRFWAFGMVVFLLGVACGGSEEVVEEPVAVEAPAEEAKPEAEAPVKKGPSCCRYDEEGVTKYARTRGPAPCEKKFNGEWIQDDACAPCCCENAAEEGSEDKSYARTAKGACDGTCLDIKDPACADVEPAGAKEKAAAAPAGRAPNAESRKRPSRDDDAVKRRPGADEAAKGGRGGGGAKKRPGSE